MKRLLIGGRTAAGMALARRAGEGLQPRPESTHELSPGEAASGVLSAVQSSQAQLAIFGVEHEGPLGLDPAAMQLAFGAPCPALLLKPDRDWPPRRIVFPISTNDVRAGALSAAWDRLRALLPEVVGKSPGWTFEVTHVGRDADEWDEARDLLDAQIGTLGLPGHVVTRSCMRFGSPMTRRMLRVITAEEWDLAVLVRPASVGRFDPRGLTSGWLHLPGGCRSSLLVLPAGADQAPLPPARAGAPWRRWLAPLRAAAL